MNWTQEDINSVLGSVIERSMSDEKFRALALKDAKAAIGKVTAQAVNLNIRFVDNAGYSMTVVLPDVAAGDTGELQDAELAGVSGGTIGGIGSVATAYCVGLTNGCIPNTAVCNYTKKPNSPAFCPKG